MTSTQTTLTSRQRVHRMFQRQDLDRIPRHDSFWSDTIRRWQGEGLQGDRETVLAMLGSDFCNVQTMWPKPFPFREELIEQDEQTQVVVNCWGQKVRKWRDRNGTPQHLGWECDSQQAWLDHLKPAMLRADPEWNVDDARSKLAEGRNRDMWCFFNCLESFEVLRYIMGDEVSLLAMAAEPDWVVDVSRTCTDVSLRALETMDAAGVRPDGIWLYGDMAFNHSTMCSPAMYRELIWPDHQRIAAWAHAHDMMLIFHTDGNVNGVLELYLEAGFDALHPLEAKAGMDVRRMAPVYGDRLAMVGNIDVMVMGSNDRERIEREIAEKFAAAKACRGYVYHSDHSVPPTVSWATYQFVMERVKHHGQYG